MRRIASLLVAVLACGSSAHAVPTIELISSAVGQDCRFVLPVAVPTFVEIKAFAPEGEPGVQGAEFAIEGLPANVLVLEVLPNSGATSSEGNPFSAGGARIVLPDCSQATEVFLFRVTLLNLGASPFDLSVVAHPQPTVPGTTCAAVRGCDGVFRCAFGVPMGPPFTILNLQPANQATDVPVNTRLQWMYAGMGRCGCLGLDLLTIYFGVDSDPPVVVGPVDSSDWPPYDPGPLQPRTTYYWRVSVVGCSNYTTPVWSFRTGDPLAVESQTWSGIKTRYRAP